MSKETLSCDRNHCAYSIGVQLSVNKGFGLFADEDIPSDHFICSNLAKPLANHVNCNDMDVFQYLFAAPEALQETSYLIVCGEMMFINHSDEPTARVTWRQYQKGLYCADLFSIKGIPQGSEITIQYKDIHRYQWIKSSL